MSALLEVKHLTKHYPVRKGVFSQVSGYVHAVDDASFSIAEGETLGLVGESGCGKSTVGRLLLRLVEPSAGTVAFEEKGDALALLLRLSNAMDNQRLIDDLRCRHTRIERRIRVLIDHL